SEDGGESQEWRTRHEEARSYRPAAAADENSRCHDDQREDGCADREADDPDMPRNSRWANRQREDDRERAHADPQKWAHREKPEVRPEGDAGEESEVGPADSEETGLVGVGERLVLEHPVPRRQRIAVGPPLKEEDEGNVDETAQGERGELLRSGEDRR